ncbi:thiamine phosphate synthase [Kangiella sediminilitoris]|uniref:Thiamine-phosphate synthase n=1 Tax=Kangiella sediminilitoris TaxID=1144748 RepID=A0A1B3B7N2_9GAMM|nr:thiamine phosphate synthase [Kangiella sediminilitoris]AOE48805.1 Thiamine-phosphate pyrophosphorylase [Kangiella sediminilitoris]
MSSANKPIVWSVAGSDCSGLAGQVADIRAIEALGAHPCTITTAVTAQNNQQVLAVNALTAEQVKSQFDAIKDAFPARVIKVGLLPTKDSIQVLNDFLESYDGSLILDPVMMSTSGNTLVTEETLSLYRNLFSRTTLITPNLPELELLTGMTVSDEQSIKDAAKHLQEQGISAVLVKGGHIEKLKSDGGNYLHDYFISEQQEFWLHSLKQETNNSRGTGCILSSAISAALAQSYSLEDSVVIGKMLLNQGLRHGYDLTTKIGRQRGPLKPLCWPDEARDLPLINYSMREPEEGSFLPCTEKKEIGLYPVVDRAKWLERLLPLGVSTIQLRIKDMSGEELEQEIIEAQRVAREYNARLFINDYWELAIKHGVYGVHLGQEDLVDADVEAIRQAGLRLGLSTHCYYEVARAHAIKPSYLACGPVYHTDSKDMPWIPHGIDNLKKWMQLLEGYPWVAIGGINLERFREVANTEVSGIAMISAITQAEDPEAVAKSMMEMMTA